MKSIHSERRFGSSPEIAILQDDEKPLASLQSWIFTNTGLSYPPKKSAILYSRMQSLSFRLGLSGISEIDRLLRTDDAVWLAPEVARAAATNFTFFYREKEVLDFFQIHILPGLSRGKKWRIWSAAAASGEEAYSIAIILAERLGLPQLESQAAILGTDISYPMIDQAERGCYPGHRLETLPDSLRQRYLLQESGDSWQVIPALKKLCTFRRLNLMSASWPFRQPFDVILCRNIFYYFDRDQQINLAQRLFEATCPGGWLLTSVTETFFGMPIPWERVAPGVWLKCR